MIGQWMITFECRRCREETTVINCCDLKINMKPDVLMNPDVLVCDKCKCRNSYDNVVKPVVQFTFQCSCGKMANIDRRLIVRADSVIILPQTVTCSFCNIVTPI